MNCPKCGAESRNGALFCPECGEALEESLVTEFDDAEEFYHPEEEPDAFEAYDYFELSDEEPTSPDIFGRLAEEAGEDEDEYASPERGMPAPSTKAGAALSVLLGILIVVALLSGVFRYAVKDEAVIAASAEENIDELAITTEKGETTFSAFLADALESAGGRYGINSRDAKKLIRTESFREFFGMIVAEYKNLLFKEKEVGTFTLDRVAAWMRERPEVVKEVCGIELDDEALGNVSAKLSEYSFDIAGHDFKSAVGLSRGTVNFFLSDAFFFIVLLLAAGGVFALLTSVRFSGANFFLYLALSLFIAGILTLAALGVVVLSPGGVPLVVSIVTSAALTPLVVAASAGVISGLLFLVISALLGRRKKKLTY